MDYGLDVEVEGILAMCHDPSSGSSFRTYPIGLQIPTYTGRAHTPCIRATHATIWLNAPAVGNEYCEHMCNYHGVYRKQGTDNFQFPSTVIVRPIYKVHFEIERRN